VARGVLPEDGEAQVGTVSLPAGRRHFSAEDGQLAATKANGQMSWTLWVRTRTYLPVALTTRDRRNPPWRTTLRWLRPSRANLAAFRITIPPHHHRVHVPVG
jgi:hypothetical protein